MKAKEIRRWVRFQATRTLPWWMHRVPEPVGRGFCVGVGRAAHIFVKRDRRLARRNLAAVYPQWDREKVDEEARRVFEEIGRNAYDFLRYPLLAASEQERLVAVRGEQILAEAVRHGRGVVLVTAHLGCWELIGAVLVRLGYPVKALARPLREERLNDLLRRHRARMGVETLSSEQLPVRAVRHLRRGGFLGVLADQRTKRGGVTVRFLGQPTRMTTAPARLALATGASVIPLGIRRRGDGTHEITVRPPIVTREEQSSVVEVTQKMAWALEGLILSAPEQWMWIHPRWKERTTADKAPAPILVGGERLPVDTGRAETILSASRACEGGTACG